jgi:histidyl-tRNA synthetase
VPWCGGRYDGLIELLVVVPRQPSGGNRVERVISQLRNNEIDVPKKKPLMFFGSIGDQAKVKALSLFEQLRKEKVDIVEIC